MLPPELDGLELDPDDPLLPGELELLPLEPPPLRPLDDFIADSNSVRLICPLPSASARPNSRPGTLAASERSMKPLLSASNLVKLEPPADDPLAPPLAEPLVDEPPVAPLPDDPPLTLPPADDPPADPLDLSPAPYATIETLDIANTNSAALPIPFMSCSSSQ